MKPTYEFLYEFYLRTQCTGPLGEFNKENFPKDYERMFKEWNELIGEDSHPAPESKEKCYHEWEFDVAFCKKCKKVMNESRQFFGYLKEVNPGGERG